MKVRPESMAGAALLTVMVALGPLSTDLYLPALPAMTRAFATDMGTVQQTLSAFLFGFAGAQLIMGPLSDRFGRRPVLLGGIALYALTGAACAAAPSVDALMALRFLQGIAACAGPVVARAVVRDVHGPDGTGRVLAYMTAAMAIAPLFAPFLGGVLTEAYGWPAAFVAMALIGGALCLAVAVLLPETNAAANPDALHPLRLMETYGLLSRSRVFVGHTLVLGFVYGGLIAYIAGSPFVYIDLLGIAPTNFGFYFGAGVLAFIAGSTAAGRLSRRLPGEALLGAGTVLTAGSGVVLAILVWSQPLTAAGVLVPMAVFGAGMGLVMPLAMAGAIGPFSRTAGAAAALAGFVQITCGAATGWAAGHVHDGTALPMALIIAAMGMAALISYMFLIRPRRWR